MSSFHTFTNTSWSCLPLLIYHSSVYLCHLADAVDLKNDLTVILDDRSSRIRRGFFLKWRLLVDRGNCGLEPKEPPGWKSHIIYQTIIRSTYTWGGTTLIYNRSLVGKVCFEVGLCLNCELPVKDLDKETGDTEMMWVVGRIGEYTLVMSMKWLCHSLSWRQSKTTTGGKN